MIMRCWTRKYSDFLTCAHRLIFWGSWASTSTQWFAYPSQINDCLAIEKHLLASDLAPAAWSYAECTLTSLKFRCLNARLYYLTPDIFPFKQQKKQKLYQSNANYPEVCGVRSTKIRSCECTTQANGGCVCGALQWRSHTPSHDCATT